MIVSQIQKCNTVVRLVTESMKIVALSCFFVLRVDTKGLVEVAKRAELVAHAVLTQPHVVSRHVVVADGPHRDTIVLQSIGVVANAVEKPAHLEGDVLVLV
mgnify:CR=1 FL=1